MMSSMPSRLRSRASPLPQSAPDPLAKRGTHCSNRVAFGRESDSSINITCFIAMDSEEFHEGDALSEAEPNLFLGDEDDPADEVLSEDDELDAFGMHRVDEEEPEEF
jgi:hypothetical protein